MKENQGARTALLALSVFAVTALVFWPASDFAFLNYDDDDYVTKNPFVGGGLTWEGVRWAFTSGHASNWHPLTWLSHMLDVELFGLDPGGHHATSVLLHALNGALCFLALAALTRAAAPSLVAALLFALHPLRVESAAWVAERKDLLAGTFFFLTLWAYARYARAPGRARHLLVGASLALGLCAKPMLVTLPALLLLLDLWPLGRLERGAIAPLVKEKLPWLALAAGSALVTYLVQQAGGAVNPFFALGFEARFTNAFEAYATYVRQTFWPTDLCALYVHPGLLEGEAYEPWGAPRLIAVAAVLLVTLTAWRIRRRAPMVPVGWLWFLGMAVPVIGFPVQVGFQGHADRYTYLPALGLVVAVVFAVAERPLLRERPRVALGLAAALCLALVPLTRTQLATWRDSASVFERALALNDENFVAHTNLGETLQGRGELEAALGHYRRALEIRPNLYPVRTNLAQLHLARGEVREALSELETALRYDAGYTPALLAKALVLATQGQDRPAVETLESLLALAPDDLQARNQLAWILATSRFPDLRDPARAYELAAGLCRTSAEPPPSFLETFAAAAAAGERFEEAVSAQDRAMRLYQGQQKRLARVRLERYRQGLPLFRESP